MIVTITADKPDAETKRLSADAPTYDEASEQAEAQITEGYRMMNIRVER